MKLFCFLPILFCFALFFFVCLAVFWVFFGGVFCFVLLGFFLSAAIDKVYQLLAHGRWFSPGTPASSTTKTGRHDMAEILLKVALNTINQINLYATILHTKPKTRL
jgi:hypothetical protein